MNKKGLVIKMNEKGLVIKMNEKGLVIKMNEKGLAWGGVLAPIIFTVALVVFSQFTPHYSNLTNAISELGISGAPYALAWNMMGFVLVGLLVIAFAWGLHLDLRPALGSRIVPILVCISGIGFVGLGLFPAEVGFQPSIHTTLHFTMVSINFIPFILVAFVFTFRLKANNYWRNWGLFSMAMGILAIASFFIPASIPVGLSQRLGMGAYFLWLFVIGLAFARKPTPSS